MNEFETELRTKVTEAETALTAAQRAGHGYEAHLHGARIRDLLDLAERHGVDTHDWVDRTLLDSVMLGS